MRNHDDLGLRKETSHVYYENYPNIWIVSYDLYLKNGHT